MLDFTPKPIEWGSHRKWIRWVATIIFIPVFLYCTEFIVLAQTIQQLSEQEKARLLQIEILDINNDLDALETSIKEGTFTTEAEEILTKLPDYRLAAELHFELLKDDLETTIDAAVKSSNYDVSSNGEAPFYKIFVDSDDVQKKTDTIVIDIVWYEGEREQD